MRTGDGLLVRVRPNAAIVTPKQAIGLASISSEYGNGLIDLTSRANLQIRGVSDSDLASVWSRLADLDLLDRDHNTAAEHNIIVGPFWTSGDQTPVIAKRLEAALKHLALGLPAKFGFAVDCGTERYLSETPADIRIERCSAGGLIVRADGADYGRPCGLDDVAELAADVAKWIAQSASGRMSKLLASGVVLPAELGGGAVPVAQASIPQPGYYASGILVGLAFGQLTSAALNTLAAFGSDLRITPWRMIYIDRAVSLQADDHFILSANDVLSRVQACIGAPKCLQAHAATRPLARKVAEYAPSHQVIHVSGCHKGCAYPRPAALTIVATNTGFDVVKDGTSMAPPVYSNLTVDAVIEAVASLQKH